MPAIAERMPHMLLSRVILLAYLVSHLDLHSFPTRRSSDLEEPVELSEEKVMGTKFSMSVQTIVGLITLISTAVGGYYMLLQEIDEAKELPKIDIEKIFTDEYPSKPDGHNWPRSYEQYKNQVGGLQEDMDAVYDMLDEYEETIKDLQKDIKDLERRKKDK